MESQEQKCPADGLLAYCPGWSRPDEEMDLTLDIRTCYMHSNIFQVLTADGL